MADERASSERTPDGGSFGSSAGWTALGALVPGVGLIKAGHRRAGGVVLGVFVLALLALAGVALFARSALISAVVDPTLLDTVSVLLVLVALAWVAVIVVTHLALRPRGVAGAQRGLGAVLVAVLAFVVAAPMAVAARYSHDQAAVVGAVFKSGADSDSATRPTVDPNQPDPWAGQPRVNVLLLGGDGDEGREGIRTDTVIVASIDTVTGDTTLFSLPRNTARMPFPAGSELDAIYPNGFYDGYDPANLEYVLFAMYRNVPALHPGAVGETDHEGADVLKLSVGEALGLDIDYYALVNLQGFSKMINALGGITVNINTHVAVGGNTDRGIYPDRYLEPGPNQHLNGGDALWFARGRYGSDDFERMARQRCVIDAVIKQANPQTVLTRYEAIAKASQDIVQTDVPQEMLPAFLELALRVRDGNTRSVLFRNGDQGFFSENPDWPEVRERVQKALEETGQKEDADPAPSGGPTGSPDEPADDPTSGSPGPSESADPSETASPDASGTPADGSSPDPSAEPTKASESTADECAFDPEAAAASQPGPTKTG
ncbi:LCP family protein [Desertihabitans aurantiacus]|uniref:LCP family protein n=1 Tax=Desertihabitans aurantiacus TaxID=2282477 RepID=UPI000DF7C562|nr:LCP family protein [Desertihabitans aurantiacus]